MLTESKVGFRGRGESGRAWGKVDGPNAKSGWSWVNVDPFQTRVRPTSCLGKGSFQIRIRVTIWYTRWS